jgi:hypothetical protein
MNKFGIKRNKLERKRNRTGTAGAYNTVEKSNTVY